MQYLMITSESGVSTVKPFKTLVERFEVGVADGKHVLTITGDNVVAFADELVRGEKTYFDECREKLNRNVAKKLKK